MYNFDDTTFNKNLVWCDWCEYRNTGLFDFDISTLTLNINDPGFATTGTYQITIPLQIPNSDVVEFVTFGVTVQYCEVITLGLTPIEDQPLTYIIFDEPLSFEIADFKQTPTCDYILRYTWRYIDGESPFGTPILPEGFVSDNRVMTVQTEDIEMAGTYTLQIKGAVSLLVMNPEKFETQDVTIEVVNPCPESDINRIEIGRLDVPIG